LSAIVVPFRPRRVRASYRSASREPVATRTRPAQPVQRSAPIRIDGSVSLYQLLRGLQAVGLAFRREPGTGVYIISPRQFPQSDL